MEDFWSRQVETAIQAGLIEPEERRSLHALAVRRGCSPMELLLEQGILSPESLSQIFPEENTADSKWELEMTTLSSTTRGASPARESSSWPDDWERFQYQAFLGQGGMGRVFLCWDPRLQRKVAVKLYQGSDLRDASRFLQEARAQARVEHDRVCKVFEVGEVQKTGYIAMQYIDGRTLGESADSLPVREIARLLSEAARGLHQAHVMGLVHCDVKPSNIMIEEDESGRAQAVVLDFGLAWRRVKGDQELVRAGTPPYMAPEQALGHALDPRTDVYGLAATLYSCLTGRPPILGRNSGDILDRIPREEPETPAALGVSVPRDLECILQKGLRKDRARRYVSAAAMADDLDAFVAGELVAAREGNAAYRFAKFVRRNKVLSSVGATLLLLLTLFLISTLRMREQARLRQDFVRTMAERGEEIEALVRYMHLTPLHDIRPERARIEQRIGEIEREIQTAGDLAEGAGQAALGRARLALGDYAAAREHLEHALALDPDHARNAYRLALALTRLYRTELAGLNLIEQEALRAKKRKELEADYLQPALALLESVPDQGTDHPVFVRALTAFLAGDGEQALQLASLSDANSPWFYELARLRGDIHYKRLVGPQKKDSQARMTHFQKALQAYERAVRIGSSDPELYLAVAELYESAVVDTLYSGGDVDSAFNKAVAAVDKALTAFPQMPEAMMRRSYLFQMYAGAQFNRGKDFGAHLREAVQLAEEAARLSPDNTAVALALARAWCRSAYFKRERGQNPDLDLERAVEALAVIPKSARGHRYFFNLGLMHKIKADRLAQKGADWLPQRLLAVAAWEKALKIQMEPGVLMNLGQEMYRIASGQQGLERQASLFGVVDILADVLIQQPRNMVAYYYLGQCFKDLGYLTMQRGEEPEAYFAEALYQFERAAEINPNVPNFYQAAGSVWFYRAQFALQCGQPAQAFLDAGEAANRKALSLYPRDAFAWQGLAAIDECRARLLFGKGQNIDAALAGADKAISETERLLPDLPNLYLLKARVACLRAAVAAEKGQDSRGFTASALTAATKTLSFDERNPDFLLSVAEAWSWTAYEPRLTQSEAAEALDRAECAFMEVGAIAPDHVPFLLAFAQHRQRSIRRGLHHQSETARQEGADLARRLLMLRPDHPEGRQLADWFRDLPLSH
ncbi:MAG: protein kinase [Acidobacteriota bacterium]|nr:protein kinase [Acidobacteriota bacterium]